MHTCSQMETCFLVRPEMQVFLHWNLVLKKSNTPRTYPSKEIKEPQRAFTPRRASQLQHKDGLQIPLAMRSDFSQEHLLGRAKSVPPCSLWSGWGSAQHKGVGFSSSIPSNPIGWKHPSNPKALKTTTWYNKIKRYCLDMNEKKIPSQLFSELSAHWHFCTAQSSSLSWAKLPPWAHRDKH